MKQGILLFLLILSILTLPLLGGCGRKEHPYDESDILGKTSEEVISLHGEFDCTLMPIGDDGLYRSTRCGYTIKEPKTSFLGTSDEILFFIQFDEKGIAVSCSEGPRPGG